MYLNIKRRTQKLSRVRIGEKLNAEESFVRSERVVTDILNVPKASVIQTIKV